VRCRVEHVFGVMKLKFEFVKVRYRGLAKNANRLFATCALVNLFTARKKLWRHIEAEAPTEGSSNPRQPFDAFGPRVRLLIMTDS